MNILLVDLDDTLINTTSLKEFFFKDLANKSHTSVAEMYSKYSESKIIAINSDWMEAFSKILQDSYSITFNDYMQSLEQGLSLIQTNEQVLNLVRSFNGNKVLFSLGNEKIQLVKINHFHLKSLFDDILITHQPKFEIFSLHMKDSEFIHHNISYNKVTIIDDDVTLIEKIKLQFPWVETILTQTLLQ
ncbi:MAG: hypothetical protein WCO06_02310 [Candidatus Roizmanbacteria bacterium]